MTELLDVSNTNQTGDLKKKLSCRDKTNCEDVLIAAEP